MQPTNTHVYITASLLKFLKVNYRHHKTGKLCIAYIVQLSTLENGISSWLPGVKRWKQKPWVERRYQKNWSILRTYRDILTILHLNGPFSRRYISTPKNSMAILNAFCLKLICVLNASQCFLNICFISNLNPTSCEVQIDSYSVGFPLCFMLTLFSPPLHPCHFPGLGPLMLKYR